MTTACFRNGFLAADRQVTAGNLKDCNARKIGRGPDGSLIAVSGRLSQCAALLRWFEGGEQGERPKIVEDRDFETWAFVARANGKFEHHDPHGWAEIDIPFGFYAIGSGAEIAYGAMAMSASAEQTGLQVDILRLEPNDPNKVIFVPSTLTTPRPVSTNGIPMSTIGPSPE